MTFPFNSDFHFLEFHRGALALVPQTIGKDTGTAIVAGSQDKKGSTYSSCSCLKKKNQTCAHLTALYALADELNRSGHPKGIAESFRASRWGILAKALHDAWKVPLSAVGFKIEHQSESNIRLAFYHQDQKLAVYETGNVDGPVLLDRLGLLAHQDGLVPSRKEILDQLTLLSMSDAERFMMKKEQRTMRQGFEAGFVYRLCYHLFFQWQFTDPALKAAIDPENGDFFITENDPDTMPRFRMILPYPSVAHTLLSLKTVLTNIDDFTTSEKSLKSVMKISLNPAGDISMELWLRWVKEGDEDRLYRRMDMVPFMYGDLIYLRDESCFARIEQPDTLLEKFKGKFKRTAKKDKIPELLDSLGDTLWGRDGMDIADESVKRLTIYKTPETFAIHSDALEQDWCYLSMDYGFGNSRISLSDIYKAKKDGTRFIPVENGWVDARSVNLEPFSNVPGLDLVEQFKGNVPSLKVSGINLFRLMAAGGKAVDISGKDDQKIRDFLSMLPSAQVVEFPGMTSTLRHYQLTGVSWLIFLYENSMSGILADDMGLGKTHQVMALMVFLKNIKKTTGPFLIVAPVTVLSHWESKLGVHAPDFRVVVHHGTERDIETALSDYDVILTSYGLLRREDDAFFNTVFSLAVFDEAQHVKNIKTQVYQAAQGIRADMKLCVTGTPIENSLTELKALMDLAFPDYLGPDDAFENRYVKTVMQDRNMARKEELSRLITPFTLRRMKTSVLTELPEKIEDVRTCRLSPDQIRLYRDAVESQGRSIRDILSREDQAIPYTHIFALLTLLKQICDHPALAEKKPEKASSLESGKWDLFTEILDEALESGQKIVVFSQFTDMITIIRNHLDALGVKCVVLTGASRNRGDLIKEFNENPECRVFVGSLLAGGTGIDLVAASVVIHYDRWWNAAKEDQATDRVHRIGQRRGVQVFKLVTQGTLEEKISAIIEKKKNLMDSVVKEDDPNLLKTFNREQLMELLSLPV